MRASQKWEDPQFKADATSLRWDMYGFEIDRDAPPKELAWKRPAEFGGGYGTNPKLWGNLGKPVPNGVNQGRLGDCWFLASASSLAENPERIYDVMYDKTYNKKGIFRFKFWAKNKWHWINIDDRLPVKTHRGSSGNYYRLWATSRSE